MYWDPLYFLVIAMFFVAMAASNKVKRTYSKYAQVMSSKNISAERAVQMVLNYYGITDVGIERIGQELGDGCLRGCMCCHPLQAVINDPLERDSPHNRQRGTRQAYEDKFLHQNWK